MCGCAPDFALDRRFHTIPDDFHDTYNRHSGTSSGKVHPQGAQVKVFYFRFYTTSCYAIVLPGRLAAGRRADFEAFPIRIRQTSGSEARFPARKR